MNPARQSTATGEKFNTKEINIPITVPPKVHINVPEHKIIAHSEMLVVS
jgi:hypothetical protein